MARKKQQEVKSSSLEAEDKCPVLWAALSAEEKTSGLRKIRLSNTSQQTQTDQTTAELRSSSELSHQQDKWSKCWSLSSKMVI